MGFHTSETNMVAAVERLLGRRAEAMVSLARQMDMRLPGGTERDRIAQIKSAARAPAQCGDAIPAAPARGSVEVVVPLGVRPTADGYEVQHTGHAGRDAARARDAFDEMQSFARRGGAGSPFTPSQVGVGRLYAALVERHSSVGVRCVSAEAERGGSGGSGGYMDAVLREGEVIASLQRAAGDGHALKVKRATSSARRNVSVRELVDGVCLHGRTVSQVIKRAGWTNYGSSRVEAERALAQALDRMTACAPPH